MLEAWAQVDAEDEADDDAKDVDDEEGVAPVKVKAPAAPSTSTSASWCRNEESRADGILMLSISEFLLSGCKCEIILKLFSLEEPTDIT